MPFTLRTSHWWWSRKKQQKFHVTTLIECTIFFRHGNSGGIVTQACTGNNLKRNQALCISQSQASKRWEFCSEKSTKRDGRWDAKRMNDEMTIDTTIRRRKMMLMVWKTLYLETTPYRSSRVSRVLFKFGRRSKKCVFILAVLEPTSFSHRFMNSWDRQRRSTLHFFLLKPEI